MKKIKMNMSERKIMPLNTNNIQKKERKKWEK